MYILNASNGDSQKCIAACPPETPYYEPGACVARCTTNAFNNQKLCIDSNKSLIRVAIIVPSIILVIVVLVVSILALKRKQKLKKQRQNLNQRIPRELYPRTIVKWTPKKDKYPELSHHHGKPVLQLQKPKKFDINNRKTWFDDFQVAM
ncbi:Hypothetical_protein [Hexamita inflata]|uniref:Hypothetical_protein n=1 Tax=Hexamita inflata TaxID=28002 RepID=A0AA86RRG9_9EUKA|nr:Hypothetical protein HINF_LOCUS65918 [Hexamita inflata]